MVVKIAMFVECYQSGLVWKLCEEIVGFFAGIRLFGLNKLNRRGPWSRLKVSPMSTVSRFSSEPVILRPPLWGRRRLVRYALEVRVQSSSS